jgi:hypothetical protein
MIDIADYTSYAEVRSTIGMSTDTLPDTVLSLELYANSLELALDGIDIAEASLNPIKTVFLTLDPSADSTAYNLTRLFSTYSVALEVAVSLSMRAPKTLSDSKVTLTRFSDASTYSSVIEAITEKLKQLKDDLESIGDQTTAVATPYLTAVKPTYDPVLG